MSSANLPTASSKPHSGIQAMGTQQYLTFTLGNELFALPIAPIREIIEFPGLTEIPLTPAFLRGVINLRGAVVPVIDLSVRFGRTATEIARRTCIVIVEVNIEDSVHPLGVIVDTVSEVLEVDPNQIEQRPGFGAGLRADFVAGMLNLGGRFVVVLDVSNVLSPDELENLISAAHVAPGPAQGTH
ncbi:chemotaxis protein CheW [Uliginosibacterium sp. H1]|uniref:chemotaxis protein CheW n=1 Tax=Uliginosibacterium sp. H1 TaxID=3114757 RepID=UPI002E175B16|nr:chemotaxis protein CheW [Uliginosibacterium sp. H1]